MEWILIPACLLCNAVTGIACPWQTFDDDYATDNHGSTTDHATTACIPCPDGWTSHYTGGSGATGLTSSAATVCLPCIAGKWDDDDDPSNECIDCEDGYTTRNDDEPPELVSSAATQCKFHHE